MSSTANNRRSAPPQAHMAIDWVAGHGNVSAPVALATTARVWRVSILAGAMGALASTGWFTAMAIQPAADVRTLGLVEVFFSLLVSRRIFREKLRAGERWGLALVLLGLVGICLQL